MAGVRKRWNGTAWAIQVFAGTVWDDLVWRALAGVPKPTTTFWYDFEGGVDGADITTGDTGSGMSFDGRTFPYMRYETAAAKNGAMGAEIDSGETLTSFVQWVGSVSALNAVGFWFKPAAFPTSDSRLTDFRNTSSSGTLGGVLLRSDGTLRLMVGTSGAVGQTSSALSIGLWYWVSLGWDATNKTAHLKISNADDSTFYDSTITGITSSYTDATTVRIGRVTTGGDIGNCHFDDFQYNQGSALVLPPWSATLKPSASNTGASGTLTPLYGDQTVTTPGTVIENREIFGKVAVQAANVIIRNCRIRGASAPTGTSNWGLVSAYYSSTDNLLVEDCTIAPDNVAVGWTGIVGHDYTARRNNIYDTVDGLGVFNTAASGPSNVIIENNYVHDLSYLSPDANQPSDDHTHNDGIQIQGNTGTIVRYNTIDANCGPESNAVSPYGSSVTGQAVGVTPNLSGDCTGTVIFGNWLNYGAQSITVITHGHTTSVAINDNRFGRDQPILNKGGDTARHPILIDEDVTAQGWSSTLGTTLDTVNGNVYDDNDDPVSVTVYNEDGV